MNKLRILVAEDEPIARDNLVLSLESRGHEVTAVSDGGMALHALERNDFDLLISDVRLPVLDGMQLLDFAKRMRPDTEVVMLTGYASVESAVEAMRKGAYQYLAKPVRLDELGLIVERVREKSALHQELAALREEVRKGAAPTIVGHSPLMRALKRDIRRIGEVDCTVLIQGETGTGKELVARALHAASPRAGERFVAVNCASFSEELMANELYGHEKSAFTGAQGMKKGLLETADKGTFFLDEVGDMPFSMQAHLLRVLESNRLMRVGGTVEVPVDLRVIAATNRDLPKMIEEGSFRRDLYYRLNVFTLRLPPLSARREDIPPLMAFFVSRVSARLGKKVNDIDDDVLAVLGGYDFPGNVRELEHLVERAVVLCRDGVIRLSDLPPEFGGGELPQKLMRDRAFCFDGIVSLEENERRYLGWVLERTGGAKGRAAELLGLNRGSLWRKLKRLGLEP